MFNEKIFWSFYTCYFLSCWWTWVI